MQAGKYCYDYPRPVLSADCVIFAAEGDDLHMITTGFWPWPLKESDKK